MSIPVVAGSNYLLQLIGTNSASYTFRLLATNSPVIVQQPRSQTVSSNASILFYVVYAGTTQTNFGFQWYFNGNGLVGETAPMLALTNVDSTQAGAYTVAVSNAAGVTMSQPAMLTVSTSNTPITLGAAPATRGYFGFSLTGESGRNYRIQASTDKAIWANANYFPLDSFYSSATSVVWNSNATTRLTVTNDAPQKFFRALPYLLTNANSAICVDNLREIRVAKMLFQRDYNAYPNANLSAAQLLPYFPHQVLPSCPLDRSASFYTSYNINTITTEPTCDISTNHICEDPR